MVFETYDLPDQLRHDIESIFFMEGFVPEHNIERVVPTGHLFLIIELDEIPRHTFHNKSLKIKESFEKAWISGSHKNYLSISSPPVGSLFVVQFKPMNALPYLQFSLQGLSNKVVHAREVLGQEILKIRKSIIEVESISEKFEVMRTYLANRYQSHLKVPQELLQVFEKIVQNPNKAYKGNIEDYPMTQKHLIDQFKKYNGLSPKVVHRIMRFNQILLTIKDKQKVNWSDITYQLGYSDQSHFIKEFKAFSGFNPQEFIKNDYQNQ